MHEHTRAVIQATFDASNAGQLSFGEVVGRLAAVDVESYHVDYRAGRATCYLGDGGCCDQPLAQAGHVIGEHFDAAAVRAAIAGAQRHGLRYPQFKQRTEQAGCTGYTVWIAGRQVTYTGRRGETHVERFPD